MAEDVKKLADKLVNLSVKEVNELADILKEEYDIEPAAAAAPVAAPAAGGGGEDEGGEEQSSFTITLQSPGGKKLNVVKTVKQITGLGLKEAKELVDNAPKPIKEDVEKDEAEEIKSKLEEAGAEVELS